MTLTLELPESKEAALKARAQAEGVTTEQYVQRVLDCDLSQPTEVAADDRPIWEVIVDLMKDVPPEDMAALPKDGASQVDHYLYGHPKRYE